MINFSLKYYCHVTLFRFFYINLSEEQCMYVCIFYSEGLLPFTEIVYVIWYLDANKGKSLYNEIIYKQ